MSGGMQGGGGVPETLLDTKGQLHGFSTENVAVDVGTNDFAVYADSSAASGLAYGATSKSVLDATGKMTYASAANTLAAISPGAEDTVLTMGASSVPAWTAPSGGGKMELVGSDILTSAAQNLQVAISPAINQSDIAYLRLVVNVKADDATAEAQDTIMRINNISTDTYNQDGIECRAGSSSILNDVAHNYVKVANNNHNGNRFSITDIVCNSASGNLEMNIAGGGADGYFTAFAYNSTASQTSFSDILVFAGGGQNSIDSRIDVYKVTK